MMTPNQMVRSLESGATPIRSGTPEPRTMGSTIGNTSTMIANPSRNMPSSMKTATMTISSVTALRWRSLRACARSPGIWVSARKGEKISAPTMIRKTDTVVCTVSWAARYPFEGLRRPPAQGDGDGQHGADGGGLERREEARIDPADRDGDHRHHRAGPGDFANLLRTRLRVGGRADFGPEPRLDEDRRHEQEGQQHPRQHAGKEQPPDRILGQNGVDHEAGGRRDQDAEGAAGGNRARRQLLVVAIAFHFRQCHLAHGQGRGDGRAAERGESRASEHGGVGKPAAEMADQRVRCRVEIAAQPAQSRDVAPSVRTAG